jgi:hypothetical protein
LDHDYVDYVPYTTGPQSPVPDHPNHETITQHQYAIPQPTSPISPVPEQYTINNLSRLTREMHRISTFWNEPATQLLESLKNDNLPPTPMAIERDDEYTSPTALSPLEQVLPDKAFFSKTLKYDTATNFSNISPQTYKNIIDTHTKIESAYNHPHKWIQQQ